MAVFTDQLNRTIQLENIPQRIISLVPSQTELLFDLGVGDRVIGITKFCIHPEEWFRNKQRVGGTKDFKIDLIRSLSPDLIIANKEENELSLLKPLMNEFPVWVSDISTLEDACSMIQSIGEIVDAKEQSFLLINTIKDEFERLKLSVQNSNRKRVTYFIWKDPWMSVGSDTFIHDMLTRCGFDSVFSNQFRYPTCSFDELNEMNPEMILLSSEPFPFTESHCELLLEIFPDCEIHLVDGEYFSWYGSRLKKSPAYFIGLREHLKIHH